MLIIVTAWWANAQISQGGTPPSIKYNLNNSASIDKVVLKPLDLSYVLSEQGKYAEEGKMPRIGYSLLTDLSLENAGTWTELPNHEGRIWQLQIKSPSALALSVYFDKFHLPVGTKLFLYNEDKTQVIGSFTWLNNDPSGLFATEMIYGDIVNLEYVEPERVLSKPDFHINEIGYIYQGVMVRKNTNWTEPSESCEVNINCSPVGDNWQDEKKGVALIQVKIGGSYYLCTGSLINNTNQNCTPYFLSAYHCYDGATASDLNQWIFYFNYESSTCTTPSTEPSSNSMTGCTLKASADINSGSDFILLQLNQTVPTSYNPYMNGWDRNNSVTGPGAGIHHPAGSIKKISTYNSASSSTYSGSASNAHWRVVWVSNSNGWGVTEGGSSGSPLFNASGNIVGTLTGGGSYCTAQSQPDYYGKLYYHWDQNAGGTTTQLKTWLDPAGSNPTSLAGKNCASSNPVAAFTGTPTTVIVGNSVTFTSQSTGTITSYSWSFPGGTPSSSTSAGPVVVTYNTVGVYNVSLTVGTPTNTLTKTNYINVVNQGTSTCDTLMPTSFSSCNLTIYYIDVAPYDSGFVSGQNAYLDKEKAMLYTGTTGGTISDVFVLYGYKRGTTGTTSVKIYTSSSGAPGTVLGTSASISKSAIDTSNQGINFNNKYHFSSPVSVTSDFFVSVVLPSGFTSGTNELAIWCAQYSCSSTSSLAYERWSDNSWNSFSDAYGTNIDLAILPLLCNQTNVSTSAANNHISMFPNPACNRLNLYFGGYTGDVDITISNVLGQEVIKKKVNVSSSEPYIMDISNLKNGVYVINGVYGNQSFTDKLQIIK